MTMLKTGLGALTVAALVLTAANPAGAANAAKSQTQATTAGSSGATDFSAQRRYRGGGGAAAAAAFAGVVGTAIAVGAARSAYDDGYGYYGGRPAYYGSPYDSYNSYGGGGYYGGSNYSNTSPGYGWDDPRNHNTNR